MTNVLPRTCLALTLSILASGAMAQVTERMSVTSGGAQGDSESRYPSISADGRYVAFSSWASNLVPGDSNGASDIFVRDRLAGTTELVSVSSGWVQGNSSSGEPAISADGRFVAFRSGASNLVAGDTNAADDVFVRDRLAGTTERVSVPSGGAEWNSGSFKPSISGDGRYVAFSSWTLGILNATCHIFVRDRAGDRTELVSVSTGGPGNSHSFNPSISTDGRYVAFDSLAWNLVPGDANNASDVFVRDRVANTTERMSVSSSGAPGDSYSRDPSISADGRFVAFSSRASNLVPGDTNDLDDVFVHDRLWGTVDRISVSTGGVQADSWNHRCSVSADGRLVAFRSSATNLVAVDTNAADDVFVRDRLLGTTKRASVSNGWAQADSHSLDPSITADGRLVAFESAASNLVAGDTNGTADVFVHDREGPPPDFFDSLCDPGGAGVVACPCANPPSSPDRGCDNSSATGGATLAASGDAYLSADDVVFTTGGQKPTATSIVLQGDALAAMGVHFGQGVRCVDGGFKRLFVKTAIGGSITAPEFGSGDPSLSARSAALGDTILAGQDRTTSSTTATPSCSEGARLGARSTRRRREG